MVVICGMIHLFTSDKGIITYIMSLFGGEKVSMLTNPSYFVPIYVISGIWQEMGWDSIIYLSALSSLDYELYEAAKLDGANRWQQTLYVDTARNFRYDYYYVTASHRKHYECWI